jgi:hypothetical protein
MTPDAMGQFLKVSRDLHETKRQLRLVRDTLRAAKLLPSEVDVARSAYQCAMGDIDPANWFQLVDVLTVPGNAYRDTIIVMELAFTPTRPFGHEAEQRGVFVEEFSSLFTAFRREVFEAYNELSGDAELNIRLTRLELSAGDEGSSARYEKHDLSKTIAPAPASATFTPLKPRSL